VKKVILGAVVAALTLVPASSAMAADELRLEGPTVSLSNIFTAFSGGQLTGSGGGPITIGGEEIGLQSQGSTRYRRDEDGERQLKWTLDDWNVAENDDILTLLIDTGALFGNIPVGNGGTGSLFQLAEFTQADNDGSAKLDARTKDGDLVPYLSQCGSLEIMIPFGQGAGSVREAISQISDIGIGTLTQSGDPADFGLFTGDRSCLPDIQLPGPGA
jgi:hypothetical protein